MWYLHLRRLVSCLNLVLRNFAKVYTASARTASRIISPKKQKSPPKAQATPAKESQDTATTATDDVRPVDRLSSSVNGEQRKPARLSKRRPSDLKIPKTSSVLSFNSLSSSFRGPKSGRPSESELSRPSTAMSRHDTLGTDTGYAFVNHDGRTEEELREHFKQFGSQSGRGPEFSEKDVIHIVKSEPNAKDVPSIPERIISPEEQRQHAEGESFPPFHPRRAQVGVLADLCSLHYSCCRADCPEQSWSQHFFCVEQVSTEDTGA